MDETKRLDNKMGVMPVGRLLFNMALPMILSMLVQAFYNVVDTFFVSKISENAVTALSLAFPIQNIQIGFATGIGVGINSLMSKSLGEQNAEHVNRTAGNGIFLTGVITVIFMLFGFFGAEAFFNSQRSISDLTAQLGTEYVAICCIGTLGIFVEVLGEKFLQASGRTVYTLFTQGTGAIINIILDPILIFGWFGLPAMGVAGAALATVIGQWVAAILAIIFNITRNPEVKLRLRYCKPSWEVIRPILTVGIPSILMVAVGSVMNYGMSQILQGFTQYGETPTGVFGIYFKLQSFFFMPVFGLNNASISIIAYNYGARQPKRITATLKWAVGSVMCIMLLGTAVFQLFPEALLGMFDPSEDFLAIGVSALRIISTIFPLAAFGIALGAAFPALGNGVYSTITSLCRQLLVLLPAAWLLSLAGDVHLVWWAFPIAEVVSLIVTLLLFARIYRQKIHPLFAK